MSPPLRIAAIEPYAALSHVEFLEGLARHSEHRIELLTLPARVWKWRMRTSAIHFARELERTGPWDALFVSDYLNAAELRALLPPEQAALPIWIAFHENQLTYPLRAGETRDLQFVFTHVYSLLAARGAFFHSDYHRRTFLAALRDLFEHVPDVDMTGALARIEATSEVLPLGTEVPRGEPRRATGEAPVILWNHRWEYDKDPDAFADAVLQLDREGEAFRLLLLGQRFREVPEAYRRITEALPHRLVGNGFVPDRDGYLAALASAHVVISTARHEFFGLGTLEALRAGLYPVLPNDLGYPELLPEEDASTYLYEPAAGPVDALRRALRAVSQPPSEAGDERSRRALVDHTDRFRWDRVAPRYDERFRSAEALPPSNPEAGTS